MRILLADDHVPVVRVLSQSLQILGHSVVPASTVFEGIDALPSVDAAIVDGFGGEGICLLELCRERGIPAVLFSGNTVLVEQAQDAGYTATGKPKGIETLLYLLEQQTVAGVGTR